MKKTASHGALRVRPFVRARVSLLALALLSTGVHAQGQLDQLRNREERERLEQEILKQLQEQQARERAAQPVPPTQQPAPVIPDLAGHEFHIDRVVLQGERYPSRSRRALLRKYEGRTLGADEMLALVRELTNDYAADGYVTTIVTLIPQNLKTGTLVLGVQWGMVKGWRFDGKPAEGISQKAMQAMLPHVDGERLNIRAVDQAVEILNNGKQTAQVNIVPAEEGGWSWLDIKVQPRLPVGGSIGLDNSGTSDDTGNGRFKTTLGASLRGIGAETWSFGGTRRHYYDGYADFEDSRSVSVSIPSGFWDFELRRGDSRYVREIASVFGSYDSEGKSNDQSLKVGRTVSRSKRGKTDVSLRVQRKDSENFIAGTRIDVNSKVYTDLVLGASRVDQLWGGSLYVDVNWSRGTKWLGANDVVINRISGDTKALYYKYAGNISWSRPIKFGDKRIDYALRSGWQYSPRHLLAANQLSIGDEFTVRGFKGSGVSGDKGIYLSNTLSMPINSVLSGFVGADVGMVRDNTRNARNEVISGFALGLKGNWKYGNFGLTYARPLDDGGLGGREVLYATATVRF